QAAERDWEEKRAALSQYSARDINRLLEETQAELMKAIPDLDFAAKHKAAVGSASTASTPEHKPSKPQPKAGGKGDPNGRRGSGRSGPSGPGWGGPIPGAKVFPGVQGAAVTPEVIVTGKKEPGFMKKAESEELETQKPQVKLRRTVSEVARPASTPPIIASAIKDDDDEERIIAELEVFQRSSASPFPPKLRSERLAAPVSPGLAALWPNGAPGVAQGWKEAAALAAPGSRALSLPQIVLTEWGSEPPSPDADVEVRVHTGCWEHWDAAGGPGARGALRPERGRRCRLSPGSSKKPPGRPPAPAPQPPSPSRAAAETPRLWAAASEVPSPSKRRQGEAGDAAPPGGGSQLCHRRGALAAQPGCPRGEAAGPGAGEAVLPPSNNVPRPPRDGDPPGAASLPSGDAPQEQAAASSRPSAAPSAGPGRAGTEDARGRLAQGLCGGQVALPCSAAPRSKEIYEGAYRRLDSLEETIRELELAIGEIGSHPAVEPAPTDPPGRGDPEEGLRDLGRGSRDAGTVLDLSRAKDEAPRGPSPGKASPRLPPKPQPPPPAPQSGGVSIPAMKVVTPASRLKQGQQGSPDKAKHLKQRLEYVRIPGQQQ
ncbi:SRCN1 inhibitor, partial [Upupa epops]|nr:SRCN1 inhibitor [Upupa epops]